MINNFRTIHSLAQNGNKEVLLNTEIRFQACLVQNVIIKKMLIRD